METEIIAQQRRYLKNHMIHTPNSMRQNDIPDYTGRDLLSQVNAYLLQLKDSHWNVSLIIQRYHRLIALS